MPLTKLTAFTKKVADLADKPNATMSAAEVKAQFDAAPDEVRQYFNNLIDVLQSVVNGDSGADNIGATTITGLTGATVQTLLESLKTQIDITVLGQIPDGSLTKTKMDLNVQSSLDKADASDANAQIKVDNLGILYWMG